MKPKPVTYALAHLRVFHSMVKERLCNENATIKRRTYNCRRLLSKRTGPDVARNDVDFEPFFNRLKLVDWNTSDCTEIMPMYPMLTDTRITSV